MLLIFSGTKTLKYQISNFLYRKRCNDVMSQKPILYGDEASPPTRFAMITAKLLNIDIHFHTIDLFKGEHKTDYYKKINPLQKVPALLIDGQTISDSHAIALYLCRKSERQNLYTANSMIRAKVDQMLYFNATTLFPIDSAILSEYFAGKWPADEIKVNHWYSAIDFLEIQLNKNKWLAGDQMQLCDICCATTLNSLGLLFPPLERHARIRQWLKNLHEEPCFDIDRRGLERLRFFIKKYGSALNDTE